MAGAAKTSEKSQTNVENAVNTTKRVYAFRSANKFLTVSALSVQFMSGKYETTDPAVAKALLTIDGVELND